MDADHGADDPGQPRYTGRQVWNRQPSEHDLIDPSNTGLGHRQVQRWGLPDGWVISARPAHPALVSEADFIAVQSVRTPRGTTVKPDRCYLLAGLLRCGICGRRLESCWANNRPAYRCRHGHTSALRSDPDRPKNLYVREDHILPHRKRLGQRALVDRHIEPRTTRPRVTVTLILGLAHRLEPFGQCQRITVVAPRRDPIAPGRRVGST